MMKQSALTVMCVAFTFFCFAQDLIVTTDARRIEAKILEVSEMEVKYKEADNLEGPTFILSTSNISSIIYANGKVTLYQGTSTAVENQKEPDLSPYYITRLGEKYMYKGVVMKGDAYANFLNDNCPTAYQLYHNGYVIAYSGMLLLSIAVGLEIGTLIGGAVAGGYYSSTLPYLYCALGCSVASIPLLVVGFNKMHKSVDIFNQECASKQMLPNSYWSFNVNQNGVGLVLNF